MSKKCKMCKQELTGVGNYSDVTKDRELVVVDEQTQLAIILSKGDCLCKNCYKVATFYRRIHD